jgi:H+-transporting ATPase
VLEQCKTEQKYIRGAMMRSLLYTQVSISGQALVFVVRTKGWSLTQRAGMATYIAFVLAQLGSTLIGIFGFGGYVKPRHQFDDCQFCGLSTGGKVSREEQWWWWWL